MTCGARKPRWCIVVTISRISPPTSIRLPLAMGSKAVTRPEVPMPPRQPVASSSSDLGAQPGRAHGRGRARRPAAGHDQVVAGLDRNLAGQPIRLCPAWLCRRRFGRGGLRRSHQGRRAHHARCAEGGRLQERSSIDSPLRCSSRLFRKISGPPAG